MQDFQFGMNWSEYSRSSVTCSGPLAMEDLLAFFLESTFFGLWIFGWDRLFEAGAPGRIWARVDRQNIVGVLHPGRELVDAARGRLPVNPRPAALSCTSIWTVLTNNTALATFPHTIAGALVDGRTFVDGISAWHGAARASTARCILAPGG